MRISEQFIEDARLNVQQEFGELLKDTQWLDSHVNERRIGLFLKRNLEERHTGDDGIWKQADLVMRELRLQNEAIERRFQRVRELLRQHDLTTNKARDIHFLDQFNTIEEILRYLNTTEEIHQRTRIGGRTLMGFGAATGLGAIKGLLEEATDRVTSELLPITAARTFHVICVVTTIGICINEFYLRPNIINNIIQDISRELGGRTLQEWRDATQLNIVMRRGLEIVWTEEIMTNIPVEDRPIIALMADLRHRTSEGQQINADTTEEHFQPFISGPT